MATIKALLLKDEAEETIAEVKPRRVKAELKRVEPAIVEPAKIIESREPVITPAPVAARPTPKAIVRQGKAPRFKPAPFIAPVKPVAVAVVKAPLPARIPSPAPAPIAAPVVKAVQKTVAIAAPVQAPAPKVQETAFEKIEDPIFESHPDDQKAVEIKIEEPKIVVKEKKKASAKEKSIKLAEQTSGPQSFKDRLRKSREETVEPIPTAETATSSFQDRLRKSVK